MLTPPEEAMLVWLKYHASTEVEEVIVRKKHGGLRERKTHVVIGEVVFKRLSDITRLGKLEDFKWTNKEKLKAIDGLGRADVIHWTHDGISFRVLTVRNSGWWWEKGPWNF